MTPPTDPTNTATPRFRRMRRTALAAVLLAGTALGGFAAGHAGFAAPDPSAGSPQAPVNPPSTMQQRIPDFSDLVSRVKPAVVSITVKLRVSQTADDGQMQGGQMQQMPFPFGQMMPQQRPQAVEARGSGFIINANGLIVTNNHVVQDAKSVEVALDDGTKLPAKIIGRDPRTDLALLKIDASHPLPYIHLGDSSKVRPGQWVVAMGDPFGLGGTVTAGIVSAQGRDIGEGPYDQFIQVDAPINKGNSGGPLFTQDGDVVGVNSAIISPTGGSVGIGFAIPSNMVKQIVAQLEKDGHVTRGFIGVEAQPITPTMAKALDLGTDSGALIAAVQPGKPAADAGLVPGDVIRSVNGETVKNPRDLAVQVAAVKPGDTAKLDVLHDGQSRSVDLKVGTMPNEKTADASQAGDHQAQVGLALAPITPDARNQLDLPKDTQGAVVAQVKPGSPADQAGIQQGDVIVAVGNKTVDSPDAAVRAIHAAAGSSTHALALRLIRNGQAAFVAVNLDATQSQG